MKTSFENHSEQITKLDTQINGVGGKGGVMEQLEEMKGKIDSLHTKLTFGIGFIAAMQFIFPYIFPKIVIALENLTK